MSDHAGELAAKVFYLQALKSVHVNLVDLIDRLRGRGLAELFRSQAALRQYTQRTGKYFPLEDAKGESLLKVLLRQVRK